MWFGVEYCFVVVLGGYVMGVVLCVMEVVSGDKVFINVFMFVFVSGVIVFVGVVFIFVGVIEDLVIDFDDLVLKVD